MQERKKLIIIGAGFAGLALLRKLKNKPFDITLIDKNNYFTFQPLLYQVSMGGLGPDAIAYPIRKILRKHRNVTFRMCELTHIHADQNTIATTIGEFSYDYLLICAGAVTNFFGNADLQKNCQTLKSVNEALDLRSDILQEFERALSLRKKDAIAKTLNFIVVGGGPTGVELAGAIAEMKAHVLPHDYKEIDKKLMHVHLVESGGEVLSMFSESLRLKAIDSLQKLGVEVWLNTKLLSYDGHLAKLSNGMELPSYTVIWAAGVRGSTINGLSAESFTRSGRLVTNRKNLVKGNQNIFALGDIASIEGDTKFPNGHPMVAPVAEQQAENLANNMLRTLAMNEWREFTYFDKGSMATIGRGEAVFEAYGIKLSGYIAWLAWMALHLLLLVNFRSKLIVFINWMYNYINYERAIRLILKPTYRKLDE
ncbi:MAG: NAD(P)/FAD-dependent oxidoreductase [Bacteroidetes bacterium]|nr:NAD(P)/FAD-dependent oxidoreductase [Bacteroidota bacterium]